MATIVLGTAGALLGGPAGRAVGSALGYAVDRRLLSPKRQGPRLSDLSVQSSAYGEPLARIYGTMRVAGAVIWSTGLTETAQTSGGKRSGGRTTSYSYSASFAVALSARPIRQVKRIWADGKLLRGSSGEWLMPAVMRVHAGGEEQAADPLIAAAEGLGGAPAYRGLAYAVFEDLPLGDFANRVPNLTFEVEADAGEVGVGSVVEDLCACVGVAADAAGVGEQVAGFGVGRAASVRAVLETLEAVAPLSVRGGGRSTGSERAGLVFTSGSGAAVALPERDLGEQEGVRTQARRGGVDGLPGEMAVSFLDPSRDYQTGLQRARRGAGRGDARDLPMAMPAGQAKRAAERLLGEAWSRRTTGEVRLPWRHMRLRPGDAVATPDGARWRVTRQTIEGMGVALELERLAGPPRAAMPPSDPGRAVTDADAPHGPTVLQAMDLPPLFGELPAGPRLWLAAAGPEPGWRRAELLASLDAGQSYETVGIAGARAIMGVTRGALPPGPCDRWDRLGTVEVELLSDEMWLESRAEASVLAGANLALIGDELVQFARAVATGERRFALSALLRGRRGTERAAAGHGVGERFVLLDPASLAPFDAPAAKIGSMLPMKALSPGQLLGDVAAQEVAVAGRALRPLSPVHLRALRQADGGIRFGWTRRSRQGFDWLDGADAPLAEERERYLVRVRAEGGPERAIEVAQPWAVYSRDEQISDVGSLAEGVRLAVAQIGGLSGAGDAREQQFQLAAF